MLLLRDVRHEAALSVQRPACEHIEPEIRSRVWTLLSALFPAGRRLERRRERAYPYPQLVHLTPISGPGDEPAKSIVVVGKHLSESGLGFFHRDPLPHRRMIASLEAPDGNWLALLLDITWCRFTRAGWYESGGRFLQAVPSPLDQQPSDASASSRS